MTWKKPIQCFHACKSWNTVLNSGRFLRISCGFVLTNIEMSAQLWSLLNQIQWCHAYKVWTNLKQWFLLKHVQRFGVTYFEILSQTEVCYSPPPDIKVSPYTCNLTVLLIWYLTNGFAETYNDNILFWHLGTDLEKKCPHRFFFFFG